MIEYSKVTSVTVSMGGMEQGRISQRSSSTCFRKSSMKTRYTEQIPDQGHFLFLCYLWLIQMMDQKCLVSGRILYQYPAAYSVLIYINPLGKNIFNRLAFSPFKHFYKAKFKICKPYNRSIYRFYSMFMKNNLFSYLYKSKNCAFK